MGVAICPGSFDPVTIGHVDVIKRSSALFDKVVVTVLINKEKNTVFSIDERKALLQKSLKCLHNVEITSYDGLLVEFAKKMSANVVVRGLRAVSDFEYELQTALTNKKLYDNIETVFLPSNPENMYISSSLVRQVASFHGDVSSFVPKEIIKDIEKKFM